MAVLTTRGALGLAGRTDIVSPGSSSERFRQLDRQVYSPLCLTLAALATPARGTSRRPGDPLALAAVALHVRATSTREDTPSFRNRLRRCDSRSCR